MLELVRELALHVFLKATQEERAQDGVKPLDQLVVDAVIAFDHVVNWVRKPLLEFLV